MKKLAKKSVKKTIRNPKKLTVEESMISDLKMEVMLSGTHILRNGFQEQMKNRPKPIEYKFSRKENKVYMYWREVRNSLTIGWNCWSFSGLISEEEVKLRLTPKQFVKFKNGDDGPFISSP